MPINTCPSCNAPLRRTHNFCQECGTNIDVPVLNHPSCPYCERQYEKGAKYCEIDGFRLAEYGQDIPMLKDQKANLGKRLGARIVDTLVICILAAPFIASIYLSTEREKFERAFGIEVNTTAENWIFFIIIPFILLLIPLYYTIFRDSFGNGQSIGKIFFDLQTISLRTNKKCSKLDSFLRNMITPLFAIIPFAGSLIEPIMVMANKDGMRVGDFIARTKVIEKPKSET